MTHVPGMKRQGVLGFFHTIAISATVHISGKREAHGSYGSCDPCMISQ